MATDNAGNKVVPVPKLLFHYIYDKINNRGIALITVNNPFIQQLQPKHKLCKEQVACRRYAKLSDFSRGYTYCCTLADFATIAKKRGLPVFPNARSIISS